MGACIQNRIKQNNLDHSLTRTFYTSPDIYLLDLERYWGRN